jgi:hypothetical protein
MLPVGGTANQVLTKINSTDYNTQWSNPTTVSVTSPITNSGTSTNPNLGLDNSAFTRSLHRRFISGRYYYPTNALTRSTTPFNVNSLCYAPFEVPNDSTFNQMNIGVFTGNTNAVVRVGIYNADMTTLLPSTLVLDAGTMSTGSNFTVTNASGNGTTVTYTANNTLTVGQVVNISGISPTAYNLSGVTVATASSTQFTVTNPATGAYVSGGSGGTMVYPTVAINQTLTAGLYFLAFAAQGSASATLWYFLSSPYCSYTGVPTTNSLGGCYVHTGSVSGALPATAVPNVASIQIISPFLGMRVA